MTFDTTQTTASDPLSLTELGLYHLIMDYRAEKGLDPIPLSQNLTTTAGRHAADTLYNIWEPELTLPDGANLHSWSDAFYYSDHRDPQVMWEAPQRIGTDYPGYGFEISAAGYSDTAAALDGWKGSTGHNTVIVNEGTWANTTWNAIGIGVESVPGIGPYGGRIFHVWFGREADPDGAGPIRGTAAGEVIEGTAFADTVRAGKGADTASGGKGRDGLFGGGGSDDLSGGRGRDKLNGGAGDDTLDGGAHKDKFIFNGRDFGTDTIEHYAGDIVKITAAGEAATRAELQAALSDVAGNAVYDHLGDGKNVIVFHGVEVAALDLDLFVLG